MAHFGKKCLHFATYLRIFCINTKKNLFEITEVSENYKDTFWQRKKLLVQLKDTNEKIPKYVRSEIDSHKILILYSKSDHAGHRFYQMP